MRREPLARLAGTFAVLFLTAFFAIPLLAITLRAVDGHALAEIGRSPYYWGRLGFTFGQALLSTLLTLLVGLPGGILFGSFDFRGKALLRSAFTVPFVMPTVVAAVGFLALLGPRGLLGADLRGSLAIILLAHVFYNHAVVLRMVGGHLESVAPRLHEAARVLGAGPVQRLLRVTLPLAAPAILASAVLTFIFSFTSFGIVLILAPNLPTLEVEIYRATSRLLQLDAAATLALVQLGAVALASRLYLGLQARLAQPLRGGARKLPRPTGVVRALLPVQLVLSTGLLLAPLLALVAHALWLPGSDGPSLAAFRALLEAPRSATFAGVGAAVANSLRFALATVALSLFVGGSFAYAVVRANWRWLDDLSLLPLATSAVTLGFGYLVAFPALATSAFGVVIAHSLVAFPFVARALLPALRGIPAELLDAATTLGARPLARLRRVELPLMAPALLTAAAFAFAISMGEFGATLVIVRPELGTIPVAIFDRLGRPGLANYGAALALAVLLMAVTAAAMMALERFGRSEW